MGVGGAYAHGELKRGERSKEDKVDRLKIMRLMLRIAGITRETRVVYERYFQQKK